MVLGGIALSLGVPCLNEMTHAVGAEIRDAEIPLLGACQPRSIQRSRITNTLKRIQLELLARLSSVVPAIPDFSGSTSEMGSPGGVLIHR